MTNPVDIWQLRLGDLEAHIRRLETELDNVRCLAFVASGERDHARAEVRAGARICAQRQDRINDLELELAQLRREVEGIKPKPPRICCPACPVCVDEEQDCSSCAERFLAPDDDRG